MAVAVGQTYFVLAQLRGQHQKQLGYLVWRQVIMQKEEIHAPILIQGKKS